MAIFSFSDLSPRENLHHVLLIFVKHVFACLYVFCMYPVGIRYGQNKTMVKLSVEGKPGKKADAVQNENHLFA